MIYYDDSHLLAKDFDYRHNPSWRIFRIMAEFIDGFTFLSQFEKAVTFFGSARFDEKHNHYQEAYELAKKLGSKGYTVITGGGPGVMEAANRGAKEGGGQSVGINIMLPNEQRVNRYVDKSIALNHFFIRKVILAFSAEAFIFFPGGFGTMDEMFELSTLIQTNKIERKVPIILVGKNYWEPLVDWVNHQFLEEYKTISPEDLNIWQIADSVQEAFNLVETYMAIKK